MSEQPTQGITGKELLAKMQAKANEGSQGTALATSAKQPQTNLVSPTGPAYRLPTAPGTVWFKDAAGVKYKRFFPDGIVRCENELEVETMESMRRVGNCFNHMENIPVGEFQKAPAPIDPNIVN